MNKITVNQRKVKSTPLTNRLSQEQALFTDLSQLIDQSQHQFVQQANSVLTMLFWHIGKRINEDMLQNRRAGYGKQIVPVSREQIELILDGAPPKKELEKKIHHILLKARERIEHNRLLE